MGLRTDKDELSDIKRLFSEIDKDNSGTLTIDEIVSHEKKVRNFKTGSKWH